ncbi:MAG TPA: plastocyanin/azurin family copper-binding protein [Myxococcales bacterium]|nr:plastocyanin/azurin family copper-binding protein [Myxococcales bacterium]
MRILGLILLVLAGCGGSDSNNAPDNPGTGNGTVIQWTFAAQSAPVQTTVAAGTPVSWHNGDGVLHNVVPDGTPPPVSVTLPGGATSETQTFSAPGTFAYHCSIHPAMRGTLTVQ